MILKHFIYATYGFILLIDNPQIVKIKDSLQKLYKTKSKITMLLSNTRA